MKLKEKTQIRMEYATRAVIEALKHYDEKHPGKCIVKSELIPHVARRAGWIMDHDDAIDVWDEAIGVPTERFVKSRWSDICLMAAKDYQHYIVWNNPTIGVRLGTFEEYQELPNTSLAKICEGLVGNADDRAKIIVRQGGKTIQISIEIKLLESGDGKDERHKQEATQAGVRRVG